MHFVETASGINIQNTTVEQLENSLAGLGGSNDFLILGDGDNYIQCAVSDTGFITEYQGGSGHYNSAPSLSDETIKDIFTSYLSRTETWKTLTTWTSAELAGNGSAEQRSESFGGALKGELSAEKLFRAVKKQVSREVGREVTRKNSGLVGKMIRKIIK
ncbi:MAG TPA: hypothetical protein DCO79_07155 [Spirochaeta sp.]|nr:hypothetical protein [Spirochaeta sp.]